VPVVVPATAIQKFEGRPVVFVRTKDGFKKRDVVLGQKEDQAIEIVSGLTSGEIIAATNTFSLKAELSKPKDED
jgi:membrane fusion protein, heavy metal efflux system